MMLQLLSLLFACAAPDPGPRRCNGHAELCERRLDEVVLPAAHNAMSNAESGFDWPNQGVDIGHQLTLGVRGMLLDTHRWRDGLWLCHGSCELGATPLNVGLRAVWDFLVQHPDEVVLFILQDDIGAEANEQAFTESGLVPFTYTHDGGEWPTLNQLIDDNTRLVVTTEGLSGPPDWLQDFWVLGFDTPYDFSDPSEFSCALNRGDADNDLFLLNHWITRVVPHPEDADVVNTFEVLHARAEQCAQEQDHIPNLVAVDFADRGDLFAVVDALNGVGE